MHDGIVPPDARCLQRLCRPTLGDIPHETCRYRHSRCDAARHLWALGHRPAKEWRLRLAAGDLENRYSKVEDEQRVTSQQVDRSQPHTQLEAEKAELNVAVEQLKAVVTDAIE